MSTHLLISCFFLMVGQGQTVDDTDGTCLVLSAKIYNTKVPRGLPLVTRVTLSNTCDVPMATYFTNETTHLMKRWSTLIVSNEEGNIFHLSYFGGPAIRRSVPSPTPMAAQQSIQCDTVRSLIIRKRPPHAWSGATHDLLDFLPAGRYTAHIQMRHLNGRMLKSNDFSFEVVSVGTNDGPGGGGIAIAQADFFEGRDSPPDESYYHGGKWWKKVDVSRFGEIQQILDEFPDSPYAEWIRFWKVYHHGSLEEGLQYARENKDFPLSDNLLLRKLEGLMGQASKRDTTTFRRARDLTDELLQTFPNGDTHARAMKLKKEISRKLRPDSKSGRSAKP